MNFNVKKIFLYQTLTFSKNDQCNKNESLTIYTNGIAPKDTNPILLHYLDNKRFEGWSNYNPYKGKGIPSSLPQKLAPTEAKIEKGTYLFVQGIQPKKEEDCTEVFSKAAEALYLESIWQEYTLSNTVYMRKLKENDKILFQLYRKII